MALARRTCLVVGVASTRSLGYHITRAFLDAQAEHVLVAVKDEALALKARRELFPELVGAGAGAGPHAGRVSVVACDVASDADLDALGARVGEATGGRLDVVVHAVAFAPREAVRAASVMDVPRAAWRETMEVSAYSLPALTKRVLPSLSSRASVMALTFDGSQRVVGGYEAMAPAKAALETAARYLASELGPRGVRVNLISAGPVRTPAARGLRDLDGMMRRARAASALQRDVEHRDVANAALFLASDASAAITGTTLHVDAGGGLRLWAQPSPASAPAEEPRGGPRSGDEEGGR